MRVTADILLRAYASGVFPMARARHDSTLYWVDPEERGILPLDGFHVTRSLARTVRRDAFQVTCDTAFSAVMEGCAAPGPGREDTWINDRILALFGDLHRAGLAHSVECWRDGVLVGGLYGLALGGAFFGESMFSLLPDASKVALVHLVARLKAGGFMLLDTQFVTDHLKRFGAVEIPRAAYRQRLAEALAVRASFPHRVDGDVVALATA